MIPSNRLQAKLQEQARMLQASVREPVDIEVDEFLSEFPPNKGCKKDGCFGRGFKRVMFQEVFLSNGKPAPIIGSLKEDGNRKRKLQFCSCVYKPYLKSGKFYHVYIQDEDGSRDYLLM